MRILVFKVKEIYPVSKGSENLIMINVDMDKEMCERVIYQILDEYGEDVVQEIIKNSK